MEKGCILLLVRKDILFSTYYVISDIFTGPTHFYPSWPTLRHLLHRPVYGLYYVAIMYLLSHHRLNADDHIQMVTALALQLIQCVIKLPTPKSEEENQEEEVEEASKHRKDKHNKGKRRSGDPVSVK